MLRFISLLAATLSLGASTIIAQEVVLKAGTSLSLRITGVPGEDQQNITGLYTISDSGTIRLPYIRVVSATGLRPSQLATRIEEAYKAAQIYTKPNINVIAGAASGGAVERYISVLGEVKGARTVPYVSGMTIIDAVAQCGGWSDFADRRDVKLIRGSKSTKHDLRRTESTDNIVLQPGDKIVVTQGGIFNRGG